MPRVCPLQNQVRASALRVRAGAPFLYPAYARPHFFLLAHYSVNSYGPLFELTDYAVNTCVCWHHSYTPTRQPFDTDEGVVLEKLIPRTRIFWMSVVISDVCTMSSAL